MATAVEVIQATLAPIFLVSGAAIFLNFTQARLFRVVDRLRAIGVDLHKDAEDDRREVLLVQRTMHLRRAVILRNAILFGVLVIAFTVVTTLLLLATVEGPVPIAFFAAALVSFAVALTLVTGDAFLSVASVRLAAREFSEGLRPGER
jgi:hypothetical protein